jgi:hypothetical protein
MSEQAWQQVLEGGGTDAYHVANGKGGDSDMLPGGESRRGLLDRMRDIVVVRGALFPETLVAPGGSVGADAGLRGDLDDDLALSGKASATEKSIDELLASLGMDDDDDGTSWKFDDDEDDKNKEDAEDGEDSGDIDDEKMASIMDELQVWRGRNSSSPYEAWDVDRKDEFDVSPNLSLFLNFSYSELNTDSNNRLSKIASRHNSDGLNYTFPRSTRKPTSAPWIRKPRACLSSPNVQSIP